MAYQARARAQSEILQLQQEVFNEVQGDTEHLSRAVFGGVDDQPDLGRISNERIDQVYRQAFQSGNRDFLQREARRDPEQFLKVAERIGVSLAPPRPAMPPMPQPMVPQQPMLPPMAAAVPPMLPGVGGPVTPQAGPLPGPTPGTPVAAAPPVPGLT
jgi:hypothetical protein